MHPGRILGGIMGLAALFVAFLLPFWNITAGQSGGFDTLYTSSRLVFDNLASLQSAGLQATLFAYVVVLGGAMVLAAGVFGALPRAAGILGLLAMLGLTLAPYLLLPGFAFDLANYGAGFWAGWALALLLLVAGAWTGRGARGVVPDGGLPPAPEAPSP